MLAVVGPAESDEVVAAGAAFTRRGLPFVSGSARRPSLTNGSLPTFFRVVPHDGLQAPAIAAFLQRTLAAALVAVVDDGSSYGLPLADAVTARLKSAGIETQRDTVDPELADFSVAVARIPATIDAVVLAWQLPGRAQAFAEALRAQNKRAAVVGTDMLDAPAFKLEGAYVTAPLPDVRALERNAAFLARYRARYGEFASAFGPAVYVAAQAAIVAVRNACRDGRASRAEVRLWLRRTFIPNSILGTTIAFTARGDLRGGRFWIFRLEKGAKTLVR